jgi:adenylate kinase family enzyme
VRDHEEMRRVVILGRGGAGKSVLARQLSALTGIPVVDLDGLFWQPGPAPTPPGEWHARHRDLIAADSWIIDGDLGSYDTGLPARLGAADTIVVLDFGLLRCAWRTLLRGRESAEYWRWVWSYRRRSLPELRMAVAAQLPRARVHVLRDPGMVRRFLAGAQARSAA